MVCSFSNRYDTTLYGVNVRPVLIGTQHSTFDTQPLMRLGIFGGSFDPVHNGHLALARACQRQVGLDEVWFMPTAVQPLKAHGPHAVDTNRVEMLRLATGDEPAWRVCTLEVERGGRSYT